MKDPMRNYKKIILGANRYSDSEESEPLLSSISSTSCSSFGSMFDARLQSESEEEHPFQTKLNIPEQNISSLSPLSVRKKFECQLIFGPNFRTPIVDMYDNKQLVLDHDDSFNKETHFIQKHRISIQSNTAKGSVSCGDFSYSNGFMDYKEPDKHTHNSLVTIFAIWNTTMGSSLLAMSWGIQLAGLFPGIVINILVAALCLYTCQLLLTVNEKHGMPGLDIEVSHLCKDLLGEWAEILANIFSIIVLLGADIVYMILMSNFLYNSVYFVHDVFVSQPNLMEENINVLCPTNLTMLLNLTNLEATHPTTMFDRVWDLYSTVPIILAVILFGVLNFKSPTFFTKFNSLGTISVLYLMVFVAVKAYGWGINVTDWWAELNIKPTFAALSGMLSLSYFIHNIIISIMRNNKNQEHNGRDLSIAFGLVTFTYLFIGILFYACFPLAKSCIEDNIFNNFSTKDTLTIVARILLMFQLFTVFPLISFMLRKDIFRNIDQVFKNYRFGDFTYKKVMMLNVVLLVICVLFACFLPKIGTLIRYTGALSGLVYVFMLPNVLKMASLKKERQLTTTKALWHLFILGLGTLNLLSQFFIKD